MIRPALTEDEEDLRTLCTSVYEDDYVLEYLSTWLREGSIYVYQKANRLVGMIRLRFSKDGNAHLGSIRVHPDSRREGIGTALTEFCMTTCDADVVRLAIMDNNPSQALARKMGFSHVATYTFLLKTVETAPFRRTETITAAEALSLLRKSPLFIQSHSLLSSSFTFYIPTLENMEDLLLMSSKPKESSIDRDVDIDRSEVSNRYGDTGKDTDKDDDLAILDFDIEEALKKTVQIAYCDPDRGLIRAILGEAARRNLEEIWAVVPKDAVLIALLTSEGFEPVEWGETIRVFEKHLQTHRQ